MKIFRGLFLVFLLYIFLPANGFAEEQFKIDIHDFLSQGFLYSNRNNYLADTETGTFQFNELGINFAADLTDRLRLGIQLAARDLGDMDNDKVVIDWAYADYRWRDWLGIRVGKMRLPLGFYNKTRDLDMLRTFIFLPQKGTTLISDISDFLKTVYSLEYTVGELILAGEYSREDFTVIDRINGLEPREIK